MWGEAEAGTNKAGAPLVSTCPLDRAEQKDGKRRKAGAE